MNCTNPSSECPDPDWCNYYKQCKSLRVSSAPPIPKSNPDFERKQTMVEGFITGCIIVFAIVMGIMLLRGIVIGIFGR